MLVANGHPAKVLTGFIVGVLSADWVGLVLFPALRV